jgi:hypothetical protein
MDCINSDILTNILQYLTKESLKNYDTAICNKKLRYIFLEAIKCTQYNIITTCKWTYIRNIKTNTEYTNIVNLPYVSPNCRKLIVFSKFKNTFKRTRFEVVNDTIEYLHIDLNNNLFILDKLQAKNIKVLFIIGVELLNLDIFVDICIKCPKLKTINIIMSNILYSERNISSLVNNKIKINVL